ncbi:hypothetical protein [Picosynechococcus sp. PCC 73109]|uniref:hypothetical protein n=1 Tax=Picosynechococcus sp. PCC 73109 TaxID=374982 RepID=UPI000A410B26
MSKLKIVIDPGSSATKVAYCLEGTSTQCFVMSPYCAAVPPDYPRSSGWMMGYTHVENAWVSHGDACYLLGAGAKKFQGSAVRNNDLKYIKALYKILGVLSHIQTQLQESPTIDLGILLPLDEYVTKDRLEESLMAAQERFEYCGRSRVIKNGGKYTQSGSQGSKFSSTFYRFRFLQIAIDSCLRLPSTF